MSFWAVKMTWVPVWVLPNINIDAPIESRYFAIVPNNDPRILILTEKHHNFGQFLGRFTDVYNNKITPAVIIRKTVVPDEIEKSGEAAISFRDILVASTIPNSWSLSLVYGNRLNRPTLSNYFWIYPWIIDRNYEYVVAVTPTTHALHEASAVHGQSSPDLGPITLRQNDFDEVLLSALLTRWEKRYLERLPSWEDVALFRSLNIANQACLIPAGPDATIFDFGQIISLWVSAFESLVHPGARGRSSLEMVYTLLEEVSWIDNRCGYRRYTTKSRKNTV